MEDIEENWRNELDIDIAGLNLIDDDDSLLDPSSYQFSDIDKEEERGLNLFGDTNNNNYDEEEKLDSTLQGHESAEPHKMMKCNLRKSLAWDKAFFTNAGVLEPDELSSMMESNNDNNVGGRRVLSTIEEDVNRSTESLSTLQSDFTVETSQEFDDVREAVHSPSLSTVDDHGSQEKMKRDDSRKRPSIRRQGLGKVTKQPVAAKEHNTAISRPVSRLGKTKGASVDVKAKEEKNSRLIGGKEPVARVPISRRPRPLVTKPVEPVKSALRSSVASKNEFTSSSSSGESCASVSPTGSVKSSIDSLQQKKEQKLSIASHSSVNGSKNIGQTKVPPLSATRTAYKSRLFANGSRLSSSVDWTSETRRVSTPNKITRVSKKPVLGENGSASNGTTQTTLKPLKNAKAVSAVQDDLKLDTQSAKRDLVASGRAVRTVPMTKPTGLRVPSPKIGYFDGAKSSVPRTPMGTSQARSSNESTASKTKSEKSQLSRNLLILESPKPKAKVSPVLRSPRLLVSPSASSSPKITNKMYSKVSAEEQLKGNEEDNVAR